jgi:hypothetical protein
MKHPEKEKHCAGERGVHPAAGEKMRGKVTASAVADAHATSPMGRTAVKPAP